MKTKISRIGKSTISIILSLLMVITCMSFGIFDTIAAQTTASPAGDSVSGKIYVVPGMCSTFNNSTYLNTTTGKLNSGYVLKIYYEYWSSSKGETSTLSDFSLIGYTYQGKAVYAADINTEYGCKRTLIQMFNGNSWKAENQINTNEARLAGRIYTSNTGYSQFSASNMDDVYLSGYLGKKGQSSYDTGSCSTDYKFTTTDGGQTYTLSYEVNGDQYFVVNNGKGITGYTAYHPPKHGSVSGVAATIFNKDYKADPKWKATASSGAKITLTWKPTTYTLSWTIATSSYTVTAGTDANGTITVNGGSSATVNSGTSVTLNAQGKNGYVFKNWNTVSGLTIVNANSATTTATVSGTATATATFTQIKLNYTNDDGSWATPAAFTSTSANNASVSLEKEFTAGKTYYFDVIYDGMYYRNNDSNGITRTNNSLNLTTTGGTANDTKFTPDVTGTYTFTFEPVSKKITVEYPTSTIQYALIGDDTISLSDGTKKANWVENDFNSTNLRISNNTITVKVSGLTDGKIAKFRFIDSNNKNYGSGVSNNGKKVSPGYSYNTQKPANDNKEVFYFDENGTYTITIVGVAADGALTFSVSKETGGGTDKESEYWVMYQEGSSNSNPSNWNSNNKVRVYQNDDGYYADIPVEPGKGYYFAAVGKEGTYDKMFWQGNDDITVTNDTPAMLNGIRVQEYGIGTTNYNFGYFNTTSTTKRVRVFFVNDQAKKYTVAGYSSSTPDPDTPVADTVTITAKDGTIRLGTDDQGKAFVSTCQFADTTIKTGDGVTNVTDGEEMQTATVEKGTSVTIETIVEAAYRNVYYVRGWCVNGAYSFGLNETIDTTNGKYTGTVRIPEEYKGDKIEITPVFFFADTSKCVTFVVEGFDETVQNVWGNTCAAYAYYTGAEKYTETLGSYPGQPMLNINGRLTVQVPKNDKNGKIIEGITLNNYMWDKQHKAIWNVTENCQTYDYDDFIEIVNEKTGVQQIVFDFKYRDKHDNEPPTTLSSSDEGTYTNGWEYLTDYQGNKVDIFGNKLSGAALNDDAAYVRVVSDGYEKSYIGDYATKWTIYDTSGKKIGVLPPSALLAHDESEVHSDFKAAYNALQGLKNLPAKITYEMSLTNPNNEGSFGNRCDGRWYYSTNDDYVQSNIKIQYSINNGATWADDEFTAADSNTGKVTECSAFFTNDAFYGKTKSGSLVYNATDTFDFEAVPHGDYVFAGWYRQKDNTITEITTSELTASSAMTSSDTFIARFKLVTEGNLNINHSLDTSYPGSGTTYLTVKVTDGTTELYNSGEVTALPNALGKTYISSDHPNYTITVTLRTVTTGKDTFHAFVLDNSKDADVTNTFFNGTTVGAGTGEATRTITFTVGDLFVDSVQTVTSINYKSQIDKTVYKYSVTYTYPSRLYGNQSYTVEREFSAKGLERYVDTTNNTIKDREFFNRIAPYEDNFMSTITWDVDSVDLNKTFKLTNDGGQNIYLYQNTVGVLTPTTETVNCLFNLPYAYNADYSPVEIDGKVMENTSSASFVLTTDFLGNYLVDQTVDGEATKGYIKAPDVIYNGDTPKYFMYWEVKETPASTTLLTKCYSQFYNLSAYSNVSVAPVYGDENSSGLGEANTSASIVYLGDSRNQWNTDKGSAPWNSADRLYADFALAFNYNDFLLNNYTGGDVETGVVIQTPGTLEADSTGGVNTDNDYYKDEYKGTEKTGVAEFINGGSKNTAGGNCVKSEIELANLSNKNRIEYYYGLANLVNNSTTETNIRNYVFRAYAYIKVGNTVTLSDPVYFNMYTTATK